MDSKNLKGFFVGSQKFPKGFKIVQPPKKPLLPLRAGYLNGSNPGKVRVPSKLRNEVQVRDGYKCRFCGHHVPFGKGMHTHHLSSTDNTRDNLVTCCIACHAIQHIGRGLGFGSIEVWKSPYSQLAIVRMSRKAIAEGKTLLSVKKRLRLKSDYLDPADTRWTTILPRHPTAFQTNLDELDKDLKVIFVKFTSWQLET